MLVHLVVYASVVLLIFLVLFPTYVYFRNVFPLKWRGLTIPVILGSVSCLHLGSILVGELYGRMCNIDGAIYIVTTVTMTATYSLYALNLLFKYKISENILNITKLQGIREVSENDIGWFLRHRYVISSRFFKRLAIADAVVMCMCLFVATFFAGEGWVFTTGTCDSFGSIAGASSTRIVAVVLVNCVLLFHSVLGFVIGFLLRKFPPDGLFIRTELYTLGGVAVLFGVAFYGIRALFPKAAVGTLMTVTMWLLCYTATIGLPIVIALRPNLQLRYREENLVDTLRSANGRKAFMAFLVSEFSLENFLFWEAVNVWKQDAENNMDLLAAARQIYDRYVDNNSEFCINISAQDRLRITDDLEKLSNADRRALLTIFDQAHHAVWKLMDSDSFPRYLKSEIRLALSKKLKGQDTRGDVELSTQTDAVDFRRITELDTGIGPRALSTAAFSSTRQSSHSTLMVRQASESGLQVRRGSRSSDFRRAAHSIDGRNLATNDDRRRANSGGLTATDFSYLSSGHHKAVSAVLATKASSTRNWGHTKQSASASVRPHRGGSGGETGMDGDRRSSAHDMPHDSNSKMPSRGSLFLPDTLGGSGYRPSIDLGQGTKLSPGKGEKRGSGRDRKGSPGSGRDRKSSLSLGGRSPDSLLMRALHFSNDGARGMGGMGLGGKSGLGSGIGVQLGLNAVQLEEDPGRRSNSSIFSIHEEYDPYS